MQLTRRLRARNEWKFFGVLPQADRMLAASWWALLVLRGLPACFAIATGALVGEVQHRAGLVTPLAVVATVFLLLQVLPAIHHAVGTKLGSRTAAWLYDQLTAACVRPPGMGHRVRPRDATWADLAGGRGD